MDDWESEDFVPAPPVVVKEQPKSQWDDEDEDVAEEDVKQSWDDEDVSKPAAAPTKPKAEKKKAVDTRGKKVAVQDDRLADPVAEKLRQQRLVEEADYQSTRELFGGQKTDGVRSLDDFIPKSEEEFLEYAELLAVKIRPFEKSFHYMTLLRALMRHSVASLKAADAKELASSMTVTANEKLKAEKDATAGKKKSGPKKKQLHVDKPDDDSFAPGTYDDIDEFDFM